MATGSLLVLETVRAARRLSKAPRFAAVAVLTTAAATAPSLIFDLVSRAVLPPLPFERSHELVHVWQRVPWRMATSYPKLKYLREHSESMDVAAETRPAFFLERNGSSVRLDMIAVTPNYFDVLRMRPLLGRTFREDENQRPFDHPVVILSETFWRKQFGARPEVLGEDVRLNGRPFTVIGVIPSFRQSLWGHQRTPDGWVPAMMAPVGMLSGPARDTAFVIESPRLMLWIGVGRLRPNRHFREARAEAAVLGRDMKASWPDDAADVPFDVLRMSEDAVDPKILHAVSVLKVSGLLVLALGGLNLGVLFLTRGLERARVLSIHTMLGAPRAALLWGALVEALVVGIAGSAAAIALCRVALALLRRVEPSILTAPFGFAFDGAAWRLDWSVMTLSFILSVTTALAGGIGPAFKVTGRDTPDVWRTGFGALPGGLRRLRLTRPGGLLVAAELAMALALTLPALLLATSLGHLVTADVGFRPESVSMAALDLPTSAYPEASIPGFVDEVTGALKQAEGVDAASWVSCVPIDCPFFDTAIKPAGAREKGWSASVHVVAPDAFRTLGIPLREGRDFAEDDGVDGPRVIVLSEQAARLLGAHAQGSRVEAGGDAFEVVGVVGDVPYRDLASERLPAIYFPLGQRPQTQGVLVVRSTRPSSDVATLLRRMTAELIPRLAPLEVTSLTARVEGDLARFRGAAWLLGAASLLALLLSAVGTYGLLASLVAQARPEIAIRMALGATRAAIGTTIATTALRLATAGLLVGAGLGVWAATYLRPYLFGVAPWDVRAILHTLVVAVALALFAALQPARRASQVDPLAILRC